MLRFISSHISLIRLVVARFALKIKIYLRKTVAVS